MRSLPLLKSFYSKRSNSEKPKASLPLYTPVSEKEKKRRYFEEYWEKGLASQQKKYPTSFPFIEKHVEKTSTILDVGCGRGELALVFAKKGHMVTAIDIAQNALSQFSHPNIEKKAISLFDLRVDIPYDVVICANVIAELREIEYRLALSNLASFGHKEATFIFSTPLDRKTYYPERKFLDLLSVEFDIIESSCLKYKMFSRTPSYIIVIAKKKRLM